MMMMKDAASKNNVRPSSSLLIIMTTTRHHRFPVIILAMILMFGLVLQRLQSSSSWSSSSTQAAASVISYGKATNSTNSNMLSQDYYTIAPGELPSYTGWARPEQTLAGYFSILEEEEEEENTGTSDKEQQHSSSSLTATVTAGAEFKLAIQCKGHEWCNIETSTSTTTTTTAPRFFVRAYGPAVLVGSVKPRRVEEAGKSSSSAWSFASSGSTSSSTTTTHHKNNEGYFVVSLFPIDPGMYTLEVVLTFSHAPPTASFPLLNSNIQADDNNANHVLYEGYLLPGFPRSLNVVGPAAPLPRDLPVCSIQDLTTSHVRATAAPENEMTVAASTAVAAAAASVARWKVTGMERVNKRTTDNAQTSFHSRNPTQVSLEGYQQSYNSLGIHMDYQFQHCRLMPEPSVRLSPFRAIQRQPLHIIMIGDSVMRLQSGVLQSYMNHIAATDGSDQSSSTARSTIRQSFIELYGGYYRTQLLTGPMILPLLQQAVAVTTERRVVVFNTGLHDIHRLCGLEWKDDRTAYLQLASQSTAWSSSSCIDLYRVAVQTMARDILQTVLPTDIVIFQTTSSAWPKYGNYGVAWDPRYGQGLPLDSSVIEEFNKVALQALDPMLQPQQQQQDHDDSTTNGTTSTSAASPRLYAVDGFWVSHARPDHRQVDEQSGIGKKLSHPGVEVISAMVRIWSMLMLRLLVG